MRFLVVVIAAAVSLAVSAYAADPLSLSIRVSSFEVLYGHALTLSGRVSTDAPARAIEIYGRPSGQPRPRRLARVIPNASGYWAFRTTPATATTYRARLGAILTPALRVEVEPAIVTRLLPDRAVWTHVAAGVSLGGRRVELQRSTRAGWLTVGLGTLDRGSDAALPTPVSTAALRLRVGLAGPDGALATVSHPFVVRPVSDTLSASAPSVRFGEAVELAGRISDPRAGQPVMILARAYGEVGPALVATVTSNAGGRWSEVVAPAIETSYRAGWDGIESRAAVVGVHPAVVLTRLAGGALAAAVTPPITCRGCTLELQRRSAGGWRTVARLPLTPGQRLRFAQPLRSGSAELRAAIGTAETATGYLRAVSQPLLDRARYASVVTAIVRYGRSLTLHGQAPSRRAGAAVTIVVRPATGSAPSGAAALLTGAHGSWRLRVAPASATTYTVSDGSGEPTLITVWVRPRLSARPLPSGAIAARVAPGRRLAGRLVRLERLTASGRWSTIALARLDRRAEARFPAAPDPRRAVLRVVIGRDTAGAGLLAGASRPFLDGGPAAHRAG